MCAARIRRASPGDRHAPLLLGLVVGLRRRDAAHAADVTLLNVSYDPTRELYADDQQGLRARNTRPRPARPIEIKQSHGGSGKQARSVIDGLAGRRRDARARLRHRRDRGARPARHGLAEEAAAERRALHLDDRVPGAQGQSEGHQGLGRPGEARRQGDHAESEDLRRRALELSRGLGLCAEEIRHRRTRRATSCSDIYKNVPVLDTGARGSTVTFVERNIGDVLLAWENEAFLAINEFGKDKFEIVVAVALDPGRAAGRDRRQGGRQEGHARRRRGLSQVHLHAARARRSRRRTTIVRAIPRSRRSTRATSPKVELFTIDEVFGGWQQGAGGALQRRRHVRQDLHAVT